MSVVANVIVQTASGVDVDTDVVGWRILYDDGLGGPTTILDSAGTTLALAPTSNVQIVMLYFGRTHDGILPYRRILHGNDFYFVWTDPVTGRQVWDQHDVNPALISAVAGKTVKVFTAGPLLDDVTMSAHVAAMMALAATP